MKRFVAGMKLWVTPRMAAGCMVVGCGAVCFVALCSAAIAQQPASAVGTGTVSGHVICGDTQRPARFATVVLFGVPAEVSEAPKPNANASTEEQMKAIKDAMRSLGSTNMVQSTTGTDGSYVAADVAPGDYYVFAAATGYVSPMSQVQAAFNAGAEKNKPIPGVQVVHVAAEHQSTADVTMVRGAAISGVISWDDGSPVTGAIFAATSVKGDAKVPPQFGMLAVANALSALAISDDLGHYRISGLPPGDYLVTATIKSGQQLGLGVSMNLSKILAVTPLVVYAPAAFHKADAKPVTLKSGEDARDMQLTLNLGGLHSVSGKVASAVDHHGINSATVRITDTQDKEFSRSASVDAAGNFTVMYVPAGTYSLDVSDAEDTEPKPKSDKDGIFGPGTRTLRAYKDASQSVVVTDSDVTGQVIELAADKNPKAEINLEDLLK